MSIDTCSERVNERSCCGGPTSRHLRDSTTKSAANEDRELGGVGVDVAMIENNNDNNNNSDNHNQSKHAGGLDVLRDLEDASADEVLERADDRQSQAEDDYGDSKEEDDDDDESMDDEAFDLSERLFYQRREQQHRQQQQQEQQNQQQQQQQQQQQLQPKQQQHIPDDNDSHNNGEDSTTNMSQADAKEKPPPPPGTLIDSDLLLDQQLSRLQTQLGQLEEKFRRQDHRLMGIVQSNQQILQKISDIYMVFESMPSATFAATLSAAQRNSNNVEGGGSGDPGATQDQSLSVNQESNLTRSAQLFEQLRNNGKLQSSLLFSGGQQQQPSQQQRPHGERHDQNNNDCTSNIISATSSISSSPSMSPIEPNLHQSQHQQHHQQHHHAHLNNSNHQSLNQTILHNIQQHHQQQQQQHQDQHERQHHHHHHISNNNGRHNSNNQTGVSSRHSSASVSPSLGPASHHSTSATSPMIGGAGGQPSGLHETNAGGAGLGALNATQAQQLLQAAVAAQQHNNNQQQQHQDPNVAALVLALGQFGDSDMMQMQSRLLATTLAAANAAGGVQHANDIVSQLQAAVKTSNANSTSILSQAVQQSNAINHSTSTNNSNNNTSANNHHHHHRNSHGDNSSPLLSRHHQASHTALAHQLAAANPINLGGSAAAMAAQLAAVARHGNTNSLNGSGQPGNALQAATGGGNGAGANAGAGGQIVHSIPHPHSHHALSHPTASLLMNNPHYQTVRTKYSTRRYSRRRVGPEEAMADPAIRATAQLKMPVVPKTILIVLKHRLTVQTAITLACSQTGERLRKGAIQKKLEAMFREPGAVDSFLAEWDHPR